MVIEKLISLSPPPKPNPPPPMVVCTVSTPSTPSSASSDSVAFSEDCSRVLLAGRVWVIEARFCPVSPRKLMFSSGYRNAVPTSTSTETARVPSRLGMVSTLARSAPAYRRLSQERSSLASAACWTCAT